MLGPPLLGKCPERTFSDINPVKSFRLYRECVGAVRLGNKISSPSAHSRYDDLYEAALIWQDDCFYGDWYLA